MILHDQKRRTMSLAHSEAKLLPTVSLPEVLLDLLQPLRRILNLQVDLRLLEMVSSDSP